MLQDVANALGAPASLGRLDTYHDFYVDPFDDFYFEPVGQRSSGVDLSGIGAPEIKKRKWTIDSLPVKNDVWVCGDYATPDEACYRPRVGMLDVEADARIGSRGLTGLRAGVELRARRTPSRRL